MDKYDIFEIAEANNLQVIETTTGMNGYPKNLRKAIIGFETFEEAESLAQKHGLRITTFFRRDGWQLWKRQSSTTYLPMHITSADYGDDYSHFYCSDAMSFYKNEVQSCLENFNSLNELEAFIKNKRELLDKIEELDDSQIVIAHCGVYYDTLNTSLMEWSYDTKNYVIGVISDEC